jgi:hypothetical protein
VAEILPGLPAFVKDDLELVRRWTRPEILKSFFLLILEVAIYILNKQLISNIIFAPFVEDKSWPE